MKTRIIYLVLFAIIFPGYLIGQSSWTRITPLPQEHTINDICRISGTNKIIAVGEGSLVMITEDEGESWNIFRNPAGWSNNYFGRTIFFLNENKGFIAGKGKSILKTTNVGIDWEINSIHTNKKQFG